MADPSSLVWDFAKLAWSIVDKGLKHKSTAESFKSMEKGFNPVLSDIKELAWKIGLPPEQIGTLQGIIAEMGEARLKYTKIGWKIWLAPWYQVRLDKADRKIKVFISSWLLMQMAKTTMQIREHQINTASQNDPIWQPESTVKLNAPLMNILKSELMKDDGHRVLNLWGFAGSGKTTFATQLCSDGDLRGWFNNNIIIKSVGSEIASNADLANQLKDELRKNGRKAVLLVLDNADFGSEQIVQRCINQISLNSKSKILVISKLELESLGTPARETMMQLLEEDDAITLLCHFAQSTRTISIKFPDRHILQKVVNSCGGFPIEIKLIGTQLREKPIEFWQKMLEGWPLQDELLARLKVLLRGSREFQSISEFFKDLALFPKDEMIPVTALIDMWVELYEEVEKDRDVMIHIHDLKAMNLAEILVDRSVGSDDDNYYNNHFLKQHEVLRELAIHMSEEEPLENRRRLIIDTNGNQPPEWRLHNQLNVAAPILSMSIDQNITPDGCDIQEASAMVLVLNLKTTKYTLPGFIQRMENLKVLIVTNYGFCPAELSNLEVLGSLRSIKRIRLQHILVPSLCDFMNVH